MTYTNQISLITSPMCRGPPETYLPYDGSQGTQIDHIIMCETNIPDMVINVQVHNDHELNTSDHAPISAILNMSLLSYSVKTRVMCSIIVSSQTTSCSISFNTCASCTHSLHKLIVHISRAALNIQAPDPWPKTMSIYGPSRA